MRDSLQPVEDKEGEGGRKRERKRDIEIERVLGRQTSRGAFPKSWSWNDA